MWFKKKEDLGEIVEKKLKEFKSKLSDEVAVLKIENQSLKNDVSVKQRVIDEQREKLRQQNEADILLLCKRIEADILGGKKKEEIDGAYRQLEYLQQQQAALTNYRGGFKSGLLGALGGGLG